MTCIQISSIRNSIFSGVRGGLILSLTLRGVLDFLEHGIGTAVSDHFEMVVCTEKNQKINGRAVCDTFCNLLPCREHRSFPLCCQPRSSRFFSLISLIITCLLYMQKYTTTSNILTVRQTTSPHGCVLLSTLSPHSHVVQTIVILFISRQFRIYNRQN